MYLLITFLNISQYSAIDPYQGLLLYGLLLTPLKCDLRYLFHFISNFLGKFKTPAVPRERYPDFSKNLLLLFPPPKRRGSGVYMYVCVYKKFIAEFDLLLKISLKRKPL